MKELKGIFPIFFSKGTSFHRIPNGVDAEGNPVFVDRTLSADLEINETDFENALVSMSSDSPRVLDLLDTPNLILKEIQELVSLAALFIAQNKGLI